MKKMQCETCGSTQIKKISEDLFECQHCGVQYSNDEAKGLLVEITGSVKIDHSDEVENAIKRGEQFENAGDVTRAMEYYDRALDMDADNEDALYRSQNASELKSLEKYYIIEPTIDPAENIENFLKQLAVTETIACDIYKEISINSVTEKYNTFFFIKNNCKCDWSATICYRRFEEVTVFEKRYDANLRRDIKTPVTKKVERIDRVPRSGTYSYSSNGLVFASDTINQRINQNYRVAAESVLENFETLQDEKYFSYSAKKIDARKVTKENDKFFYNGYELDLRIDKNLCNTKNSLILERADQIAADNVIREVGGDFSEGWSATRAVTSHSVSYICIPVQIIEYNYKGQNFVAVSDLVSRKTSMPLTFPCDKELADAKNALKRDNTKTKKMPSIFVAGITVMVVDLLYIFLLFLADTLMGRNVPKFLNLSSFPFTCIFIMLAILVTAITLMIIGGAQLHKLKKDFNSNFLKQRTKLYIPRMIALSAGYEAFFKEYSGVTTVEDAAKSANTKGMSISDTYMKLSSAGDLKEFSLYSEDELPSEDKEILRFDEEISRLKKKRVVGIVLTVVSCIVIIPLFLVGIIIIGNCNSKIKKVEDKKKALQEKWLNKQ